MPRKARIESSANIYHVINRGNYRSSLFETDAAKERFEVTLAEAAVRNSWRVLAYCVMSNHFHLCLATPKGNLSEGMRWLQATFATRFNRLRKESGHLFQGRFKSLIVQPGERLGALVNYIHLNPLRARLETADQLGTYAWSSLHHFPKRKTRPAFLDCSWLSELDGIDDTPGGWSRYRNLLRLRVEESPKEIARIEKEMNRGWCIGSPEFKEGLAAEYLAKNGAAQLDHDELKEFNQLQWERWLKLALKTLGINKPEIAKSAFSAPWKLAIASRMKRETSVTNQWLSDQLHMGHPNGVSSNCGVFQRTQEATSPEAKRLKNFRFEH